MKFIYALMKSKKKKYSDTNYFNRDLIVTDFSSFSQIVLLSDILNNFNKFRKI